MFLRNSRYFSMETVTTKDCKGRLVQAVKLRRPPETNGIEIVVNATSQLDIMSKQQYEDPTRFWHIADANTELEVNELISKVGRVIKLPGN